MIARRMANEWPDFCPICKTVVTVSPLVLPGDAACSECGHVFWFLRRDVAGVAVLDVISGKISINQDIKRVSESLKSGDSQPRVVLNLVKQQFVSSSFIAGLIALHKHIGFANGKLVLCSLSTIVRETLNGAKLDKMLNIVETEEDAIDCFKQSK